MKPKVHHRRIDGKKRIKEIKKHFFKSLKIEKIWNLFSNWLFSFRKHPENGNFLMQFPRGKFSKREQNWARESKKGDLLAKVGHLWGFRVVPLGTFQPSLWGEDFIEGKLNSLSMEIISSIPCFYISVIISRHSVSIYVSPGTHFIALSETRQKVSRRFLFIFP